MTPALWGLPRGVVILVGLAAAVVAAVGMRSLAGIIAARWIAAYCGERSAGDANAADCAGSDGASRSSNCASAKHAPHDRAADRTASLCYPLPTDHSQEDLLMN